MALRPSLTLALTAALLCAPACTKTTDLGSQSPALEAPASIDDLDDYARARNAYELTPTGDPERARLQAKLQTYLVGYLDHALDKQQDEAALEALEQLAGLWRPRELRSLQPNAELVGVATRVYERFAPAGNERPALLALGIAHAFAAPSEREELEGDYTQLRDWIARTGNFGNDPRSNDLLERLLEDVTGVFPTTLLIDALAEAYLDRYRAAQLQGGLSDVADPRVSFAPYLLARVYLLADDLDAAVAVLERLGGDQSMQELLELIKGARDSTGPNTADLDQLVAEFVPEPNNRLPEEIARQSWVIVDNLSQRTLARVSDHAPAHLARGRVLRSRSYIEAAIYHYERAFSGKARATTRDDLRLAWSELAELYQLSLEFASVSGAKLDEIITRVEAFHDRAAQTWPQQQLEPDITLAWMTVAVAEYNAGHIERARDLLDKVVLQRLQPEALSLLATIALRSGELEQARLQYTRLDDLSADLADQLARYDWQIDAHLGLAEVEAFAGQPDASVEQLRETLAQLNTLLGYPGLPNGLRTEFSLRRARVFFFLGELELAMEDVRTSQRLSPEYEDAFTEPLLFTVSHGHLEQAKEIFDAALARDGDPVLSLYYSLWLHDLSTRVGADPDYTAPREILERYAANQEGEAWLRKLAAHSLGQLDDASLVSAASGARERSEAYFYTGLARWRSGSHDPSLEAMRKVLEQGMMGDFEYRMAQSYLYFEALPRSARAALDAPQP